MRVNNPGNSPQGGEVSGAKQSGRGAAVHAPKSAEKGSGTQEAEKAANRGATAEISAKSKEFAQAKAVASGTPDTRDDKIEELKRRISEGNYKIDTSAIADRMVDDHLRMSGTAKSF